MPNISDFDKRQMRLIEDTITKFKKNEIELGSFISNLEAIYNMLEFNRWKQDFLKEWGQVEDAYSIMLYEGRGQLRQIEQKEIEQAILNINKLLKIYLKQSD